MFNSPVFLIGSVLGTLWGGIYYAIRGKKLPELFLYWVLSLAGFFIGHLLADYVGLAFFQLGDIHVVEGSLGSWILMAIAHWLGV